MSRRSIKSIDANIDLTGYYLEADNLPDPWDATELFGRAAPLVIEVGSGKGLFVCRLAIDHPERNVMGIEVSRKYARHAAARLARTGAAHARMVQGDAIPMIVDRLPADSVAGVHVYFPDPWWKKRHRRRRIISSTFVAHVQRVLLPGGQLHFWTDVKEYFESALEIIGDSTQLRGPHFPAAVTPTHDLDYRTNFERRMRTHGIDVFRSEFTKD